ncbi:hypothetical protein HZC27_02250 [Candidatus Roizmanbacteria bacterium]|nr:hypothetical protein [Candidatus Roizmanbacteria bacterium]
MKKDFFVLVILSVVSTALLLFIKANFLVSTLVFFGLPSVFLSFRQPLKILKTFTFSFLMCIPFTFIFDYLIAKDRGWYIVNSVFPWRLFDIVVIEQFIWCFLYIYYIVMFYEYFLDKKEKKTIFHLFPKIKDVISPNMEYFSLFMFMALAFFYSLCLYKSINLTG